MQIERFTVGMFQVNTYLITDEATGHSALIDTGEGPQLVELLRRRSPAPNLTAYLLTHAHLDHAGALASLQRHFDAPTYLPTLERPLFELLPRQGSLFGMPALDTPCGRIDTWLDDGDSVRVGSLTLRFLSTPGHTPGMGCYYDEQRIFVGDTLFAGSIGRTDFFMSDPQLMKASLRKLLTLPPHLVVHSGHGPDTTLGEELATNPFLGFLREERGLAGPPGMAWW